jgi:hypothetical protein
MAKTLVPESSLMVEKRQKVSREALARLRLEGLAVDTQTKAL